MKPIRRCFACDLTRTYVSPKGKPFWYLNHDLDNTVLCAKCYERIITRPRRFKNREELNAWIKEYNKGQIPPNKGKRLAFAGRECFACGSKSTYTDKTGRRHWRLNLDLHGLVLHALCNSCWLRIFSNPVINHFHNHNRIQFKDKQLHLQYNPRTGFCSQCGNVGRTHLHHEKYDPSNPNSHTVELCMSCHMKRSWQLGQLGAGVST